MNSRIPNLKRRVTYAGGWSLASQFLAQALRLGSNIVLTRLLAPELFGVMSIAMAFLAALVMFSDVGLHQNVIQHPIDDDEEFLNTIWTAQIIRAGLITAAGFGLAGLVLLAQTTGFAAPGTTYSHPSLPIALAIVSATALISGFGSTNLMTAGRRLMIGPVVTVEVVSQIVGVAVCIVWALYSPTILAVTSGAVASALAKSVLSHMVVPGIRNRPCWARSHYSSIHRLGKWIFVSSVVGFMVNMGDRLLFGGILPADAFGIYSVAALFIGAPMEIAMRLTGSVIYPALTEVHRQDPDRLSDLYYRFRLIADPPSSLLAGIIIASSPAIVDLVFGEKFSEMSNILPILALCLLVTGHLASGNLYMIIGKPRLMTLLIVVRLVALYVTGPILALHFGMVGAAWAVVIGYFATVPVNLYLKAKHGYLRPWRELLGFPFLLLGGIVGLLLNRAVHLL